MHHNIVLICESDSEKIKVKLIKQTNNKKLSKQFLSTYKFNLISITILLPVKVNVCQMNMLHPNMNELDIKNSLID